MNVPSNAPAAAPNPAPAPAPNPAPAASDQAPQAGDDADAGPATPAELTPAPEGGFIERSPCKWHVQAAGDELISAYSSGTNERFVGTRADFAAALRA